MTTPNIINAATINGKLAVQLVGTSATAIVSNATNSNSLYKINILTISNVDSANACSVVIDLYRGGTAYRVGANISIPNGTSFAPIDKTAVYYLEEGDSLRLAANVANRLEATCSYEVIA